MILKIFLVCGVISLIYTDSRLDEVKRKMGVKHKLFDGAILFIAFIFGVFLFPFIFKIFFLKVANFFVNLRKGLKLRKMIKNIIKIIDEANS